MTKNCPYYCSTLLEPLCNATGMVALCQWCDLDIKRLIAIDNGEIDPDDEED